MGQKYLLSQAISQAEAVLLSGEDIDVAHRFFQRWTTHASFSRKSALLTYSTQISQVLNEVISIAKTEGGRLKTILKTIKIHLKNKERQFIKLEHYEKQYAFQGAVIFVLPWAIYFLVSTESSWSFFYTAGLLLQIFGLGVFYIFVKQTLHSFDQEKDFLQKLLLNLLMYTEVFESFKIAFSKALEMTKGHPVNTLLYQNWHEWSQKLSSGFEHSTLQDIRFNSAYPSSAELADVLVSLQISGAVTQDVLRDLLERIYEEDENSFQERLQLLPSKISILFSLILTPAFFLILTGILWPSMKNL